MINQQLFDYIKRRLFINKLSIKLRPFLVENNKQQLSDTIGKIAKTGGVVFGIYDLLKNAVGAGVFILLLILFMFSGLPIYIGVPFILLIVLIYAGTNIS